MEHQSIWQKTSHKNIQYPSLKEDIEVDVAIIGGGITGVTGALELLRAGKKVAIIDAYSLGGVTTSLSTGNLYVAISPFYQTIVKKFGQNVAQQVAQSRALAIDYIENNVNDFNLACNFTRRSWYAYSDIKHEARLNKEYATLKQLGLPVETVSQLPLDVPFKTAFMLANQARFNPLQYVVSLGECLYQQGCFIFENTRVTAIEDGSPCILKTEEGNIKAQAVFMATHTPLGIQSTQLLTAPYRSYVIGFTLGARVYPEYNIWGFNSAYHALSTHSMGATHPNIITVAGSHHKTGQEMPAQAHFDELIQFIHRHFQTAELTYCWSAQHYQSADGLPYIGIARGTKHCYLATGYFADGLVYGTCAGKIVAEMILRAYPLAKLFSAKRFKPLASFTFVAKENANVWAQYAQDLPQKEQHDFSDIKKGEGKIVEIDHEKVAVCRDEQNKLHKVSAVCTHMKCIVNWNDVEQTWDCPCHGSRFKTTGEVIEGPALYGLKTLD